MLQEYALFSKKIYRKFLNTPLNSCIPNKSKTTRQTWVGLFAKNETSVCFNVTDLKGTRIIHHLKRNNGVIC